MQTLFLSESNDAVFSLFVNIMFPYKYVFLSILSSTIKLTCVKKQWYYLNKKSKLKLRMLDRFHRQSKNDVTKFCIIFKQHCFGLLLILSSQNPRQPVNPNTVSFLEYPIFTFFCGYKLRWLSELQNFVRATELSFIASLSRVIESVMIA